MKTKRLRNIIQKGFGCALILFALNKFFSFFPLPEKHGFAKTFLEVLENSGYMMPMIAFVQFLVGFSLIFNQFVPLSLLALLPITINIFLFHISHDKGALIPAFAIFGVNIGLVWMYSGSYESLLIDPSNRSIQSHNTPK